MNVVILANASAGRLRDDPALVNTLAGRFQAAGARAELWKCQGGDVADAARRAVDGDYDRIVVAGGDGTVRTVASILADTDKTLGVLPLGTLNHFARDLGMPLDPAEAIPILAHGPSGPIDVAEVNGHVFVNNSSIGLYSQMVLERDARRHRSRLRKFAAMGIASVRVLYRFPLLTATVVADGQRRAAARTPLIMVSNNPYTSPWPHPAVRARLDTGRLGIYLVQCSTRIGFLHCAWQVMRGRTERLDSLEPLLAAEATIASHHHKLDVSLDGEVVRLRTPLEYRSRSLALRVVHGPAPHEA